MNNRIVIDRPDFMAAFRSQCRQVPDQCALVHDTQSFSYAQLDTLSDRFASDILAAALDGEQSVALFCERSVAVVAAMLGCLKAGVAFVPVDMAFPDERIRYLLSDSSVGLILTDKTTEERARALASTVRSAILRADTLGLDDICDAEDRLEVAQDAPVSPKSPAYIMYTSGSTGRPKGVPISQAALTCYCQADADVYQLSSSDRTLQFATLSFDISIEEIFPPLMTGGTVVLRPSVRGDAQIELSDIIQRYSVTAVHLATGYWHEWVDLMTGAEQQVPESLRLMVVTGEQVSPEHYARWLKLCGQGVLWANAYGPTETTVSATVFIPPVDWQGSVMPIGKALPGYTAYILNEQLQAVSDGETGELYIGGGALAECYLNQSELTAKAFVSNPFGDESSPRLYRTGDLARWLDGAVIECAGRIDHQLKIGSYRVEPGEIEHAINQLVNVRESLVSTTKYAGRTQLLAYVSMLSESENFEQTSSSLKEQLNKRLPVYMVPSLYVLMDRFPKTINGKIDRKALPDATHAVLARHHDAVAARSDTERALCDIWQDVLGITSVGVNDSFVSLGGDSLMAVRSIARIQQQLQFTVSTRDFFFLDTIALLAGHMEGRRVPRLIPPANTFFINSRHRQLYAVMQQPSFELSNGAGLLFVPPLGNEQRRCQRPFRGMMQTLARDGYHLMRFDWRGTDNSSGSACDIHDLSAWGEDLQDAAEKLASSVDTIHLVSVRFGALISSLYPPQGVPLAASYLWDPVISGAQWLAQMHQLQRDILNDTYRFLFRRRARTDPIHEFAGLALNDALCRNIERANLDDALMSTTPVSPVHLFLTDEVASQFRMLLPNVSVHADCESNDWMDDRATIDDMKINRVARRTMDLIHASVVDLNYADGVSGTGPAPGAGTEPGANLDTVKGAGIRVNNGWAQGVTGRWA